MNATTGKREYRGVVPTVNSSPSIFRKHVIGYEGLGTFVFRSLKTRDAWRYNRVNRSYNSEVSNKIRIMPDLQRRRIICKATLTMTLHDTQEFYNDLRRRSDEDLPLAASLGIDNVLLWD